MAVSHDAAFGSAAVDMRVLTSEQVDLGAKVQKVLTDLGIAKSLAVIAVEAGWMELDQALVIVTGLRRQGVVHPEVKPRSAADADDSVLERLTPGARKRLENASRTLASLFYARGAGTLALDQGSPAASRPARAADPTPAPRRVRPPVIEPGAPPPRKSSALGAIIAVFAAVLAIIGYVATRPKPAVPEPEPPPTARRPAPPPPRPPPPPPAPKPPPPTDGDEDSKPSDSSLDAEIEAEKKKHIEMLERDAAKAYDEIKTLLAEGRPTSALGKLKRFIVSFEWTEFYKNRKDEIARLLKETEGELAGAMDEGIDQGPDRSGEGPPLPALAAAFKRLDEGASADFRRNASAKTRLAGWKSDLVLRGGKIVKAAEVVDVTREDLRIRGELDGAKVDLLLTWSALDAASFMSVQRQIARGQGASGLFEMGRAAVLRRLWKDAKSAFEECARADAAWKSRLPDLGALFADPALFRGSARRLGDGRLLVDYSFADADQAADFAPAAGAGTLSVAGGTLKIAAKDASLWTLKDLPATGDAEIGFVFEGSGEASVGFDKALLHFSASALRTDVPGAAPSAAVPGSPVTIERRDRHFRVRQNGKVLFAAVIAEGPLKPVIGGRGEITLRELRVAVAADATEMARRLGPLERLEGGALAGDFKLDPIAMDGDSFTRAAAIEAALDAGQIEDAATLAEEAIAKTPAEGLATVHRGLVRLAQGELRMALADADLAIALDPCRGDVVMRARRILGALRGASAAGAFRRIEAGPWVVRSDVSEARLAEIAGILEEAGNRCSAAFKETGPAPKGVALGLFASAESRFVHLENADGATSMVDAPGVEPEVVRRAAAAYLRRLLPSAPAWVEAGLADLLSGASSGAEMKDLLPHAIPIDTLIRKSRRDFRESDRIQSASFLRFLTTGPLKEIVPDLLKKLRNGVPSIEAFSGRNLQTLEADWKAWVAKGS